MFTSAETIMSAGNPMLDIRIYLPAREFDVLTDDELTEKVMHEVKRYIKSERKRQERFKHLPIHFGGRDET